MRRRFVWLLCAALLVTPLGWGCGEKVETVGLVEAGQGTWSVVIAADAGRGVQEAAEEVLRVLREQTGATFPEVAKLPAKSASSAITTPNAILLGSGVLAEEPLKAEELQEAGEEGYIWRGRRVGGKGIFQIAAQGDAGVQYGAYALLRSWGVRYFHPADTYTPKRADGTLTLGEPKKVDTPKFALRGFHHHTQHPIPMSVYLLEPDDKHLPRVREYVLWLARNRQNLLQWHMLKTVDLDKWLPYIKKVRDLAKDYGVKLGLTVSFADQQQNNFKLVEDVNAPKDIQAQAIVNGLNTLLEGGFQVIVMQFGTSEFTKVGDELALHWLNTAAAHLASRKIENYAWIHTEGKLKADDEKSYYFHLPERAAKELGAYLHTTMFYDLKNPAPVYGNENFHHQKAFLDRIDKTRPIVYFPETAWWLGFDNNLPLAMPVTGHSRALDILEILKDKQVKGHVTFTSGMEWGYWKYDHFLTRITWDRSSTWPAYVQDFAATFGPQATVVSEVLNEWTKMQVRDFYGDFPEVYFYLAGELPQDELGQQAGILARRPKRAFREIYNLEPAAFATWEQKDLAKLIAMQKEAATLFAKLPKTPDASLSPLAKKLYQELYTTLQLYVWRVEHTVALYESVRLARKGRKDGGVGAESDAAKQDAALKEADVKIKAAEAITVKVKAAIKQVEKDIYRYPMEILATQRDSLTSYKFGYLWETSTAFFWTRRDEQARRLYLRASGQIKEEWGEPAPALVFQVKSDDLSLLKPDNPTIKTVVGSFIPSILFNVPDTSVPDGDLAKAWRMATDHNKNGKPDPDTVASIETNTIKTDAGETTYLGKSALYKLLVFDETGNELGSLGLQKVELNLKLKRNNDTLETLVEGTMRCDIILENLVSIATQVAGLDRDSLYILLGSMLKFDPKSPPRSVELLIGFKAFAKVDQNP